MVSCIIFSMDSDAEELPSEMRLKTDVSDGESLEDNTVSEEANVLDDNDSFLQDFLSKRPISNLTLFQRVIRQEEEEANQRNPADDLKLYRDACADFSDCVSEISEIKASKPEGWKEQINEIRKEAAFTTLIMKKLNRLEKTRTRISRERISRERQKADVARVTLDNMLSEIQHMRKEIDKCLKFRSKPLGIDLIPTNEFYEKASAEISKPEITKVDEHQLQLARLEWELHQRKELADFLSILQAKKRVIAEDVDKKERDLNSLAPLVKDILQVVQPLKEKLGPVTTKITTVNEKAGLLPDPLYFIYVNVSAYSDAIDKDLTSEILGDLGEAQKTKIEKTFSKKQNKEDDGCKENFSEMSAELEQKNLLLLHPLSVVLKILMKDGPALKLQFFYMKNLGIITVIPAIILPPEFKTVFSEVFTSQKKMLHNLFPGDNGQESPNLMNYYQLLEVNLEALDVETFGYPYIWAQKIGGLNFCGLNRKVDPKLEVSRSNFPIIIKELKKRCQTRLTLLKLIECISRGNVISSSSMNALKTMCEVKTIKLISWTQYCEESSLPGLLRTSSFTSENDILLKAVIQRNDEIMSCLISIKPEYPVVPCLFAIDWDGMLDEKLRRTYCLDIEREVNVHWKEFVTSAPEALLSYQLFKAMICFDIVLESLLPEQFSSNKQFSKVFRGRRRELPFQYKREENIFFHRN